MSAVLVFFVSGHKTFDDDDDEDDDDECIRDGNVKTSKIKSYDDQDIDEVQSAEECLK